MYNDQRGPLLITSFRPWRSHQPSNSSQDLIAAIKSAGQLPNHTVWLPQVPVNFELAPIRVINAMYRFRPRAIVCCGMAENRPYLSLEQQAKRPLATYLSTTYSPEALQTSFDLTNLLADTQLCEISYDAGSYVCNALYYRVLEAIHQQAVPVPCLFVHVPVLKAQPQFLNRDTTSALIQADMLSVLNKICV